MSRSNPQEHAPNPATCWFEWNGENGSVRYYDKEAKKNIEVGPDFTFMVLDKLARVGGWHNDSDSGIYSNEVRDTRKDVLIVKSFKGGTLIEGVYRDIKDRANSLGGQFVTNLYIAVQDDEPADPHWHIASLRFKGAALNAWVEFEKEHRRELFESAVTITGFHEGKKGRIVYRVPTFELVEVTTEENRAALALDKELQAWLKGYFARRTVEQADTSAHVTDEEVAQDALTYDNNANRREPLTDDDIPFVWLLPLIVPALASLSLLA